jgi:uncharacterized protein YcbK (DUF882 family)
MVRVHPALAFSYYQLFEQLINPLVIKSGFRCLAHNHTIGGTQGSYHMYGMAIDVQVGQNDRPGFVDKAKVAGFTGIEQINKTGGYHLDVRSGKPYLKLL